MKRDSALFRRHVVNFNLFGSDLRASENACDVTGMVRAGFMVVMCHHQ